MPFTFGPFLTCFIITFFLTIFLHFIIHHSSIFFEEIIKISIIGSLIIFIRMVIPINFPFTYTIYSYEFLPKLLNFAAYPDPESAIRVDTIMLATWFIIAAFLLLRLLFRYLRLKHYLSQFYVTDTEQWRRVKENLQPYCKRTITIAVIPYSISPAITGFFNPTIILPDISHFSEEEIHYICVHEISHYTKHHLWLSLLMEIVCRIHWWNPLVQYMKKEFSLFLELSNDSFLIQTTPKFNTVNYADVIIKTAKLLQNSKTPLPSTLLSFSSNSPSSLTTRIRFILEPQKIKGVYKKAATFTCSCIISVFVFLSVFIVPEATYENYVPNNESMGYTLSPENTYIIDTGNIYQIYLDGEFFGEIDHIPEDLKNIPIYKEGDLTMQNR